MSSETINLEKIIKCSVHGCKQTYNLVQEDLPNCARPMLTTCNQLMCFKCYKKNQLKNGENDVFMCPFDHNEHIKPTNANRLHNIIRYFDVLNSFTNLKKDIYEYNSKKSLNESVIHSKINEMKHNIKDHVKQITTDLNKYLSKMLQDLDSYVTEWNKKEETLDHSLNLDQKIKINENCFAKIENNLKEIEMSIPVHKPITQLKECAEKDLAKLELDIKTINDHVLNENELIKIDYFLMYKKGRGINNDLENIVGTLERKEFTLSKPYEPVKYENFVKEIRLELSQNEKENGKYLKAIQNENKHLERSVKNLSEKIKMLTKKFCVDNDEIIKFCTGNDYQKLEQAIKQRNCNVNKICDGCTALIWVSEKGDKKIAQLLIENGATVNEKDNYGKTAIICASQYGHTAVVQLLIENGAILNEKDNYGETALMKACGWGHKEIVHLLIDNGAIVNKKRNNGDTALILASGWGHKEVSQLLIDNGAIVNEKDNAGLTALMWSSENGRKEVVQLLIDQGAFVNEKDNDGRTALMLASVWGHKKAAQLLINNGATVNEKDNCGTTAIICASLYGHKTVVQSLINNGAVLNAKDNHGKTAYMLAFERGHKDVAKLLIEKGASNCC